MKCYDCVCANVCIHYDNIMMLNNNVITIKEIDCGFYKKEK